MGMTGKRWLVPVLLGALALSSVAATLGLQGCGKDQAKQDFVDGVIAIIEENQSQPEIAAQGQAALTAYYESGFTDLASAAAAAQSFIASNEKDTRSLDDLRVLQKPDGEAGEIADTLRSGIEIMDEGNSVFASELEKAPRQSVEERSELLGSTMEAMNLYLEGISAIISSCEMLRDYAKKYGLDGHEDIQTWIDKFTGEKESIEKAIQYM
ncbi:MAG: hypothetical protein H5T73_03930 [Actinobacteria bacterium]|nr:hypothetical protein [Actinomycetota bacterium]